MFKGKDRPSGMEFASCEPCNHGTRAADAAAGFFSRLDVFADELGHWKLREARRPLRALRSIAPGFAEELFDRRARRPTLVKSRGGILLPAEEIHVGPIGRALVSVFATKLGMAFYREHVGEPLPVEGGVYTLCFLNAGFQEGQAEALLSILPVYSTLLQGRRKSAAGQFDYRFNTDGKSIVGTLSHFHGNIHVFALATAHPDYFARAFPLNVPFSALIKTGELLRHMPKPKPATMS
jgi:hypothetical protein